MDIICVCARSYQTLSMYIQKSSPEMFACTRRLSLESCSVRVRVCACVVLKKCTLGR